MLKSYIFINLRYAACNRDFIFAVLCAVRTVFTFLEAAHPILHKNITFSVKLHHMNFGADSACSTLPGVFKELNLAFKK